MSEAGEEIKFHFIELSLSGILQRYAQEFLKDWPKAGELDFRQFETYVDTAKDRVAFRWEKKTPLKERR